MRLLAEGAIRTEEELAQARSALVEERQSIVSRAQDEAIQTVELLGGNVVARYQNLHALRVSVAAANVVRLLDNPRITYLDAVARMNRNSSRYPVLTAA
jgi:hypothetical protein